jgi:hypothetical protein
LEKEVEVEEGEGEGKEEREGLNRDDEGDRGEVGGERDTNISDSSAKAKNPTAPLLREESVNAL